MPTAKKFILPSGRSTIGKPESWPLPPEAARILARVGPTSIPVLCLGSSGTAFTRIATTLHRASSRARLVRIDLRRDPLPRLLELPEGRVADYLTLALDGLEALDDESQRWLAAYLDGSAPRLICAARGTLEELTAALREDLLSLLSTVTVDAPALRERRDELPRLADERLRVLAAELEVEPAPVLSPAAHSALAAHDWPGDVTELDGVLLDVLLREEPSAPADADDLRFRERATSDASREPYRPPVPTPPAHGSPSIPAPPSAPPTSPTAPAPPADETGALDALESVAVELAHQLKNPLVTVKTFIANAARMDEAETSRFREIALDGIDRIDGPLDQILDFSRLPNSTDETLEVSERLGRAFGGCRAVLDGKQITVEGLPPTRLSARGTSANVDFALETLCRHVADTIEPHSILAVSRPGSDVVRLHYRESGASTHLRGVTGDPESSFPLALLLVRGALTRMGGGLRTSHAHNEVTIELSFMPA